MMNIETLLQAAQILENQQSVPPKKRLSRSDRPPPEHHLPTTNVLSSPTSKTNASSLSTVLTPTEYSPLDLNLNVHHFNHRASKQQRFSSDQNDDDDEDDDDDQEINPPNNAVNSDISNRAQSSCLRDREIHNRLEKHRRAHLKDCFDSLKAEVPCQRDRKVTNLQVLNFAIKYIQTLNRRERSYEREMSTLTARNIELQQRLGALKIELHSQGHDVDTWLSSCTVDLDYSVSTQTASEAEMYRTFEGDAEDDDEQQQDFHRSLPISKPPVDVSFTNGHDDLDTNNNHQGIQSILNHSYAIESKGLLNNRKTTTRSRPRPAKRKLATIPTTTNLLQTLTTSVPSTISRSENLLDYSVARQLRLDQPCNLLTTMEDNLSSTATLTPITDIRYEIVDMFTKGTSAHLQQQQQQQQQQISPLPSIASLMNRHASPIVSPTKQTIGINTDPLTTSTTNILHQPVATS